MKNILLIFLMSLLFTIPAHAFRCGNNLISPGDTKEKIVSTCGNQSKYNHNNKLIYNCGSNDFVYVLMFDGNDILFDEHIQGRGHGSSQCLGYSNN